MKNISYYLKKILSYLEIILAMMGYVLKHVTVKRTIIMLIAISISIYFIIYQSHNSKLAFIYFILAEVLYISFIYLVLAKNGYRKWFIKKWGEEKGFLVFEGVLGFLFFNNGASIGYLTSATSQNLFNFIPNKFILVIVAIMFVFGFMVKIFAAKATSIDIYYWKDMFLDRKISEFVVSGPYKYFNNPMYGVGQLQGYAMAIWYGSGYGLLVALLNQCLIFSFYYSVEKKFINSIYKIN